jgi:hypothetical protein
MYHENGQVGYYSMYHNISEQNIFDALKFDNYAVAEATIETILSVWHGDAVYFQINKIYVP